MNLFGSVQFQFGLRKFRLSSIKKVRFKGNLFVANVRRETWCLLGVIGNSLRFVAPLVGYNYKCKLFKRRRRKNTINNNIVTPNGVS